MNHKGFSLKVNLIISFKENSHDQKAFRLCENRRIRLKNPENSSKHNIFKAGRTVPAAGYPASKKIKSILQKVMCFECNDIIVYNEGYFCVKCKC